jgi:DNA-binding LacI/PurR family transcriptional regulator
VELQSSLEELLYAKGYKILLYGSLFNREKEEITLQMLKNNMIDGIILGSFTEDMSHFIQSSLPIVSTGRKIAPHIPVVKTNGIHGGILAAKHLMGKKCKKILYITTYPGDLENEDERFNGFKSVLLEKEIQFWTYQISINEQIHNDFTPMITQMLLEHPDADGIFAETDLLAMSCIQTCCRLGYAVPKDIKIVGYGNHYFSSLTNPALTTVDSDKLLEAQEIVDLLLSMIETDCINVKDVIIPVSLIERQST